MTLLRVQKCPVCKIPSLVPYMGGQFGKSECKKCGYIGALVIEQDFPSEVPAYYRSGFDSWLARLYDFGFKIVFFGRGQRLRDLFVQFVPADAEQIIDLATGTGAVALTLKRHFPKAKVYGLDLSQTMLDIADKKARRQGLSISWLKQNIEKMRFKSNTFDAVTLSFGLHELPPEHRQNVLREAYRVLRKQGRFVLMDLHRPQSMFLRVLLGLFMLVFEEYAKTLLDQDLVKVFKESGFRDVQRKNFYSDLVQVVAGIK